MYYAVLAVAFTLVTTPHATSTHLWQNRPEAQQVRREKDDGLTNEDKAELVRLTLERALIAKAIPDYNVIEKQESFLLSTENITAEVVPKIKGITLVLLEPAKIKERANSKGDYVYYFRFREFRRENGRVLVLLDNIPMYADKPKRAAFGGGFTIEYRKQDGKWVGKQVLNWIV